MSDSLLEQPKKTVWVWFCTNEGRAVQVSDIDPDEFDWPGQCPTCQAPTVEGEYEAVVPGNAISQFCLTQHHAICPGCVCKCHA